MISILCITVGLLLLGTEFLLREMDAAPEGYQTEDGFNIVWKNNSPDLEDVSCVWSSAPDKA